LSARIERQLERLARLAHGRLSPREAPENPVVTAPRPGNGGGKAATTVSRLHFRCLDNHTQSYILRWLNRYLRRSMELLGSFRQPISKAEAVKLSAECLEDAFFFRGDSDKLAAC
jgi:hypothetical protein